MIPEHLKKRIEEFHLLFQLIDDDYEDFDEEITEISRMDNAQYEDFIARRTATPFGEIFYRDFHDFVVNEIIPEYLDGNTELREALILYLDKWYLVQSNVWCLMREYLGKLQHSTVETCPEILRRFLLFALLGEESLDHYETGNIIRGAWYTSEYIGIDPEPYFKEAAAVAGTKKVIFDRSAQEILGWYCEVCKSKLKK